MSDQNLKILHLCQKNNFVTEHKATKNLRCLNCKFDHDLMISNFQVPNSPHLVVKTQISSANY